MCFTIHQTLLPHDDPDASMAFDRDTLASRSATSSDTAERGGSPSAAPTGPARPSPRGRRQTDEDTMSMTTEVRNG
jgi:hypothetical protein